MPAGKVAEGTPGALAQARRAEGIGHQPRGVANEQRGLQRPGQAARRGRGRRPRRPAPRPARSECRRSRASSRRVGAGGELDLGQQRIERGGLSGASARSTSRACTLPEPSQTRHQRRLPVGAGEARLLDVPEPALAFQRLGEVLGCALADPVLEDRRGQAPEHLGVAVARVRRLVARARRMAPAVAASDSSARSASTAFIAGWSISGAPKARGGSPSGWPRRCRAA